VLKFIHYFQVLIINSNVCGSLRFEIHERQTIFAIDLKNSAIKFTILTEVDSQQQSFPLLSFKNVKAVDRGDKNFRQKLH